MGYEFNPGWKWAGEYQCVNLQDLKESLFKPRLVHIYRTRELYISDDAEKNGQFQFPLAAFQRIQRLSIKGLPPTLEEAEDMIQKDKPDAIKSGESTPKGSVLYLSLIHI